MLGRRYRDFIDAIKRYVGASIDHKPISLFTIIFVGGGGVAMRGLGMVLMFAAHLVMAWFSTPSDLGSYFLLIGVTNIVATAGSLGLGRLPFDLSRHLPRSIRGTSRPDTFTRRSK